FSDVEAGRAFLLRNRRLEETELPPRVREGVRRVFGADVAAGEAVDRIIADVRQDGDAALRHYTHVIDGTRLTSLEVTADEIASARAAVPADVWDALVLAKGRIEQFHQRQYRSSWIHFEEEGALGQILRPLERV